MSVRLPVASVVIAITCLLALCFTSSAVNVGRWTTSSPEAVPLSRPAISTFNIQYQPEGYYLGVPPIPVYAGGTNFYEGRVVTGLYGSQMTCRGSYMRYFGLNTLMEPVDSNYPGNAFITQFLADP